jgi:hypothetical protein
VVPNRKRQHVRVTARAAAVVMATLTLPFVAGCGSDDDTASTTLLPSTSESTSTTEPVVDPSTNVESLSYLMQGLLTTPQIGGGWVDMGRVIVPPSKEPSIGPLCPDGASLAEPIGTTLNAQVHTTFQRISDGQSTASTDASGQGTNPALVGGTAMETLLWNDRQQVDQAFAALAAATDACIGTQWSDVDMGEVVMNGFDAPTLGTDSFTFGYEPTTPPTSDPWAETKGISILLSDESSPVSIVVTVSITIVHNNPDQEVAELDTAELTRIAQAAVARIMDGL